MPYAHMQEPFRDVCKQCMYAFLENLNNLCKAQTGSLRRDKFHSKLLFFNVPYSPIQCSNLIM